MKTICLLLVLCVLQGCQSTKTATADAEQHGPADASDPTEIIRVYRLDGRPFEADRATHETTRAALDTKLSLSSDNLKFSAVIEFVRAGANLNLAVNWPALELVGIDQDSLLSLHLKQVPARTLLEIALEQVSADAFDDDKAGLAIRGGIVKISTRRELYEGAEMRIYDVSWFVDPRRNITTQLYDRDDPKRTGWLRGRYKDTGQHIAIEADKLADWRFYCAHCWGTTSKDGEITYEMPGRQELIGQLIESIHVYVGDENEWLDDRSTVSDMAERLTISTTPENHDAILELLKMHRRLQVEAFEQQAKAIAITLALREAEKYRLKRDHREALEHLDHALRIDPNHAEAKALRRLVVQAMGD